MRFEKSRNILIRTFEDNRSLGRHRRIGQDNIKMDLKEVGCMWAEFNWFSGELFESSNEI
jgi:hypothetical protein